MRRQIAPPAPAPARRSPRAGIVRAGADLDHAAGHHLAGARASDRTGGVDVRAESRRGTGRSAARNRSSGGSTSAAQRPSASLPPCCASLDAPLARRLDEIADRRRRRFRDTGRSRPSLYSTMAAARASFSWSGGRPSTGRSAPRECRRGSSASSRPSAPPQSLDIVGARGFFLPAAARGRRPPARARSAGAHRIWAVRRGSSNGKAWVAGPEAATPPPPLGQAQPLQFQAIEQVDAIGGVRSGPAP